MLGKIKQHRNCTEEKGPWECKIKQHCQMFGCLLLMFFGTFFDIVFSVQNFEGFPKSFMSKRERVVYFLSCLAFFPHCHKRFRTGLCLFWHGRALLSLTSPLGTSLCSLKTSGCNRTWSNMQHRHAPETVRRHKICTMMSLCSYVHFAPGLFSPQKPLGSFSSRLC